MPTKNQVFNPFLPSGEYLPDPEPHVFDGRVYVYGSHDRFGGAIFCLNDYVCWSAPQDDLSDWRYEGVIYRKRQHPGNPLGLRLMFAPDVVQGPDKQYYLYYALDFSGIMSVAKSAHPAGPFEFYGHVRHPEGRIWGRKKGDSFAFDPAVINDDGRILLYSGFAISIPSLITGMRKLDSGGGVVLELEKDMLTIKVPEKLIFPISGPGSFPEREFFEASSIRKIRDRYYFVYSSRHNHDLCYAVSDRPDGGFAYGGRLISNGDIGLDGVEDSDHCRNYIGNNHGGLLELDGRLYIFYHRHTNRSSYSRQACAQELVMNEDGSFDQVEMTSCGLNGAALEGRGCYEARIVCNLWSAEGTGRYDVPRPRRRYRNHPYLTQGRPDGLSEFDVVDGASGASAAEDQGAAKQGRDRTNNRLESGTSTQNPSDPAPTPGAQYIANMTDGAVAGFKYFAFSAARSVHLHVGGKARGEILVSVSPDIRRPVARIPVKVSGPVMQTLPSTLEIADGEHALYFCFRGDGAMDFHSFTLT